MWEMKGLLLAGIMTVVVSSSSQAATITYEAAAGGYNISINGDIKTGDAKEFEHVADLVGRNPGLVILNSDGGAFIDGKMISQSIRRRGWNTQVKEEQCVSACAIIWIGGVKRWATEKSLIGFHGVYNSESGEESSVGNALAGAFLKELGLSDDAIVYLTMAPSDMVVYLTAESASKYSIAYEGRLPTEAYIQLLLQFAMKEKEIEKHQGQPPNQSQPQPQPPPEEKRRIVAQVAQNLNLRSIFTECP